MQGRLFIISSPSGGGKGTLIQGVLKTVPQVGYSISFTTRPPRAGEQDGREYFFVSPAEFENLIAAGELLEHAVVHGNYYGTSRRAVEAELIEGRDVILEIDVQGAAAIKNLMTGAVSVFILPPSFAALRERLERRGSEKPADVALRLHNSSVEVARYDEFDYVIINDEINRATEQLAAIFYAERARRDRMEQEISTVLRTFKQNRIF